MITQEQLNSICDEIKAQPISEHTVGRLRRGFSDLHFTYCMDDDVDGPNPVFEDPAFNLYLIDSRGHCLSFTQDMDAASGIVVAEIEEE